MTTDAPLDDLLLRLQAHDEQAARVLFHTFAHRLIALADLHIRRRLRPRVEAEDVVQSVFRSFFRRQAAGQWQLDSWERLWALLCTITVRKCGRRQRHALAARRGADREVASGGPHAPEYEATSREPTPEEAAVLAEELERLLHSVDGRERRILALTLEGEGVAAIAEQVGCSQRKVYRVQACLREHLEALCCADE